LARQEPEVSELQAPAEAGLERGPGVSTSCSFDDSVGAVLKDQLETDEPNEPVIL